MELIAGYLCNKAKVLIGALVKLLVSKVKWIWKRFLTVFLRELLIACIIELIINHTPR